MVDIPVLSSWCSSWEVFCSNGTKAMKNFLVVVVVGVVVVVVVVVVGISTNRIV